MGVPYELTELHGAALLPLPTGKKSAPPTGWTGANGSPGDIEEFYAENDFADYSNHGLALTDSNIAGFDFDLHRTGTALSEVADRNSLTWTVGVSRHWEPNLSGFTAFYRTTDSTDTLRDVAPVDIIRKGHRYSVIAGEVDALEYFLYWTNGIEFYRITPETFAAAWETLPEAPEWLQERHTRPRRTSTHPEALVAAVEGVGDSCHRVNVVAANGVSSIMTARENGGSINQAMLLAQWALTAYVNHSGFHNALAALLRAYERACAETDDHAASEYEWTTSLAGAYRKRGLHEPIRPRRCDCSTASFRVAPEAPDGSLASYYPLVLTYLAREGVYGEEATDLAHDIIIRVMKSNPSTLTAAYFRTVTKSAVVDEWRSREAKRKAIKRLEEVQLVRAQVRKQDAFAAVDSRLTLEHLLSVANLTPSESEAVRVELTGAKLDGKTRKSLSLAKKKLRLVAVAQTADR